MATLVQLANGASVGKVSWKDRLKPKVVNLITNPTFDTDLSGWDWDVGRGNIPGTWDASQRAKLYTINNDAANIWQIALDNENTFSVKASIEVVSGTVLIVMGTKTVATITETTEVNLTGQTPSAGTIFMFKTQGVTEAYIDNVVVSKEL